MKKFAFAIFCFLPLFAFAAISQTNKPISLNWDESESSKVKNGFSAMLILTPDKDWKEKWDTPQDTVPSFSGASKVKIGDELTMLIFFANPKPDKKNNIKILCDVKITRPDKSISLNQKGVLCAGGQLQGVAENIRLSNAVIKFVAEESDPRGIWVLDIGVEDANRKTTLALKTQFDFVTNAEPN